MSKDPLILKSPRAGLLPAQKCRRPWIFLAMAPSGFYLPMFECPERCGCA